MEIDPFSTVEKALGPAIDYVTEPHRVYELARNIFNVYATIVIPVSFVCLIIVIYCVIRLRMIRAKEHSVYYEPRVASSAQAAVAAAPVSKTIEKWKSISKHADSANANDWKLAIIEADIMLADLLDSLGYQGDTIGDKLKRAVKGDFKTLDLAWEAHKVRNAIAHQGSDFAINQYEAKRVIDLYQQVFSEFKYC